MTTISDILYENGNYWVRMHEKGWYEVYRVGITHSVRCATIGYKGNEGLTRAITECNKRAASKL